MASTVTKFDPLAPYLAETETYVRHAKSENTIKAYRSDWTSFETFCQGRELPSLPAAPATVAAYAAETARRLKANTIERHLTAISQAHQLAGVTNPVEDKLVRTVMAGIRRVKGTAQTGKEPLTPDILRKMFARAPDDLRTVRDRALLLVGFAGAFRRSERVGDRPRRRQTAPSAAALSSHELEVGWMVSRVWGRVPRGPSPTPFDPTPGPTAIRLPAGK